MNKIIGLFKWGKFKFAKCIFGIFISSLAINLFIVPNNLYTGGILGLAQLIRSGLVSWLGLQYNFDISSIIYYMINIPLFLMAYKEISRTFFYRTLFAVSLNSIFLIIIPIPSKPLIDDLLGNVLIGGILGGAGIGMVLSTGGSTGGTDIIGFALTSISKKITVGSIALLFNLVVYGICGYYYGISIMIYSIIYAMFESFFIDRHHMQNICSNAFIFTKEDPTELMNFITQVLNRGVTYWEAKGGYTNTRTYIVYTVVSKYERMRLERHINEFDRNAFMVGDDGVEVRGHFDKYLV